MQKKGTRRGRDLDPNPRLETEKAGAERGMEPQYALTGSGTRDKEGMSDHVHAIARRGHVIVTGESSKTTGTINLEGRKILPEAHIGVMRGVRGEMWISRWWMDSQKSSGTCWQS